MGSSTHDSGCDGKLMVLINEVLFPKSHKDRSSGIFDHLNRIGSPTIAGILYHLTQHHWIQKGYRDTLLGDQGLEAIYLGRDGAWGRPSRQRRGGGHMRRVKRRARDNRGRRDGWWML